MPPVERYSGEARDGTAVLRNAGIVRTVEDSLILLSFSKASVSDSTLDECDDSCRFLRLDRSRRTARHRRGRLCDRPETAQPRPKFQPSSKRDLSFAHVFRT